MLVVVVVVATHKAFVFNVIIAIETTHRIEREKKSRNLRKRYVRIKSNIQRARARVQNTEKKAKRNTNEKETENERKRRKKRSIVELKITISDKQQNI